MASYINAGILSSKWVHPPNQSPLKIYTTPVPNCTTTFCIKLMLSNNADNQKVLL